MCIIAMYSGQVSCIQHMLRAQGLDRGTAQGPGLGPRLGDGGGGGGGNDGPMVHTVDSFQGSEADVVILSFVRNNTHRDIGFLRGFQRLNVALTRAKHLLLAVGCADTLMGPDPPIMELGCNNNNNNNNNNHTATHPDIDRLDRDHHRHYYLRQMITDARTRGRLFSAADVLHSNVG